MARYHLRRRNRTRSALTRGIIGPGAAAGVIAATVMGLFFMIVSAAQGSGFFTPMKLIGAFWLAGTAMTYDFASVVLGIVTHLAVGAFFGIVFSALTRNIKSASLFVAAGLGYGAAVMLLMTYAVLPWADPIMFAAIDEGWFFISHLVFGLTLPLALPMRRHTTSAYEWFREDAYSRP